MPTLNEQDVHMTERKELAAVQPGFVAVSTVNNDPSLDVNKDDDWVLDGAVGLDEIERVEVN